MATAPLRWLSLTQLPTLKHLYLKSTVNVNKYSSVKSNPFEDHLSIKYEVSKDPNEWKYVERVLPLKTVPEPKQLTDYPSGWKPQAEDAVNLPFYVGRTKNHMIPVYLKITRRGMRRLTYLRNIHGDIWLLEKNLVEFLQQDQIRPIRSQVNELAKCICFHGDYVNAVKYYLMKLNL